MKKKESLLLFLVFIFSFQLRSEDFSILTRLQLDSTGTYAESRVRVDMIHGFEPSYYPDFEIRGFATFYPCKYLGICAGNSFFKKYPVRGAWLSASDDYLKTGKLLKNGAGLLGKIPFSENIFLSLSFSGSPESWNETDEEAEEPSSEKLLVNLNCGAELSLFDSFSLGTVFYKMNSPVIQFGLYAGLRPADGFFSGMLFNAGYIYNFRDSFMAKTEHAVMCSLGYEFKDYGIGIYGDLISGLNDRYFKKSGNVKSYGINEIPFYTAVRFSCEPLKKLVFNVSGNYVSFYDDIQGGFGLKAGCEYKISKKIGTLEFGVEYNKKKTEVYIQWKMKVSENK